MDTAPPKRRARPARSATPAQLPIEAPPPPPPTSGDADGDAPDLHALPFGAVDNLDAIAGRFVERFFARDSEWRRARLRQDLANIVEQAVTLRLSRFECEEGFPHDLEGGGFVAWGWRCEHDRAGSEDPEVAAAHAAERAGRTPEEQARRSSAQLDGVAERRAREATRANDASAAAHEAALRAAAPHPPPIPQR